MAEKDTKPKTTAKSAASEKPSSSTKPAASGKPATKSTTAKPATSTKSAAKPATTAKPAAESKATTSTPKPAAKPAASSKSATSTKPAAKPAAAESKATASTPKPAAKPAASSKPATKPAANTKPAPVAKTVEPVPAVAVKAEKTEKPKKQQKTKASGGNGGAAAALKNNKTRIIIISVVAFVLIFALVLGIVLGAKSCQKNGPSGAITIPIPDNDNYAASGDLRPGDEYEAVAAGKETFYPENEIKTYAYDKKYVTNTQVGYSSRVLGTVERVIPQKTRDEGLGAYPKFGYTLSTVVGAGDDKTAMRQALIEESDYFCALGTRNNSGNGNNGDGTFTWMDKDGLLYSGTTAEPVAAVDDSGMQRRLYKHSTAIGMYYEGFGDMPMLSPDEPAIIKEVSIRPRGYSSYSVTGVYAPAGEVIKIRISEEDMNATGGITIHIGQALYNGQSNNIWAAKGQMQRFPNILNTMNVNKDTAVLGDDGYYTAYVGSFVGGPLYIRNTLAPFTATISGGVAYSHFILGVTTKEEFEANSKSTAPYFDLEVWHNGVLHSGPKYFAKKYSYEDIYNVAVLWDKVASVTTTGSNYGVVFLYEPFVAAGAAVAFPGRNSVNCPAGWMDSSLNYNGIVTGGSWGNFHEYHHNYQGYGVGNGGEVTNNGMTLVSYALFTKISAKRGIGSYGGQGLGGWNNYTSATWALNDVLSLQRGGHPSNGDQGLALYATLLHNFGADNYIQARIKGGGQSYQAYANAWEAVTHNNMSYYFNDVLKGGITSQATTENPEYPMFVPVSSVYQTGRSYMYDGVKKYFKTMQPYVVPYESSFTLDLSPYTAPSGQYASGSIVIPDGLDYEVKSVVPAKGTVEKIDDLHYKYNFQNDSSLSGEIKVTLGIKKNGVKFTDDIELIVELERSHETNKMTLERTVYTYTADNMYDDAVAAYEANFAGYTGEPVNKAHTNPTQNCNTDIWFVASGFEDKFPNVTEDQMMENNNNTVHVIDGKLYFEEAGTYRIYLRGRKNCAVYYSTDGGATYQLGAHVTNGSGANFYVNDSQTYFDVELSENSWVYFKEVLIVKTADSSYIGLGYGAWTTPLYRMVEKYYDANGNEVASPDAEGYHHTTTVYYDSNDHEVSADVVAEAKPVAPTRASYVNAYRCDYVFPDNSSYKTDYFYTRKYNYTYSEAFSDVHGQFVGEHNCFYNENRTDFRPEYLLDGDKKTVALSKSQAYGDQEPWTFTVDLGKEISANSVTITGYMTSNQNQTPTWLELYLSKTGNDDDFVLAYKSEKATITQATLIANFEMQSFRYYKICAKNPSYNARTPAIADVEFSFSVPDGEVLSSDNSAFNYAGNWNSAQAHSTFGHVMVGSANATMSFKFSGTRFAIRSLAAYGKNFEVTVDGVKVNSIKLKDLADNSEAGYQTYIIDDTPSCGAAYITDLLDNKEHTVVIKCLGEANIDSIVIYK